MSQLPAGWTWTDTASVAEVQGGIQKQPKRAPRNNRYPFLRVANVPRGHLDLRDVHEIELFDGELEKFGLCRGDLLVVEGNGSPDQIGRSALWLGEIEDCVHQNHLIRVRPTVAIHPKFLDFYWNSTKATDYLRSIASSTSGLYVLTSAKVRGVRIPLAPLEEQKRIVAAVEEQFSRLDAGVAALKRVRQNLKRMRAALLHTAVTGRLVPQNVAEGSGADLLSNIRNMWPKMSHQKRSRPARHGLRTDWPILPENWATAPWRCIGTSQNGRAFPSRDYTSCGTKLLRPGNLYESGEVQWNLRNTRCLPERYAREFPEYLIGPNEIVMNLTAQSLRDDFLGRVCLTHTDELALLNQRIARLTPLGMDTQFVFWVLKSPSFRRFVDQLNTGSLIQHMFTSQLDQFEFPIPPLDEQRRIVSAIEASMSALNSIEGSVVAVEAWAQSLRSSVLAAAFSGQLLPQDVTDEPASVLLDRIAAERASSNGHMTRRARTSRTKGTI